jgi:hypothetical protein
VSAEIKKKPPVALVALAPIVGVYSILMPYAYWRLAALVWETSQAREGATVGACFMQAVAAIAFCVWKSEP